MNRILGFLRTALPFLQLSVAVALLINTAFAAELQLLVDALTRAISNGERIAAQGGTPQPAKGLTAIKNFTAGVLASLKKLAELPVTLEELQAGLVLVKSLDDSTLVYQPKSGDDKRALDDAKAEAKHIYDKMIADSKQ